MASFSEMLKYYRKCNNLSQAELAKLLDLSASTISMYEVGAREPSFEVEERIADYFNVDLNTLRGKDSDRALSADESQLLDMYQQLNSDGKQRTVEYVELLSKDEKYKKDTELLRETRIS